MFHWNIVHEGHAKESINAYIFMQSTKIPYEKPKKNGVKHTLAVVGGKSKAHFRLFWTVRMS